MGVYFGGPVDDYSAMQGPCASGFHIPTNDDWQEIMDIGDALSLWAIGDSPTTISTYLKLPFSGRLAPSNGNHYVSGSQGAYWTSENYSTSNASSFAFSNQIYFPTDFAKGYGLSIRPFKDTPVVPDSSWTALYSDKIYHNSTLGLISLSSDGTNWITIADKNLGATAVYNNGDTLSESNCGKFYQWGNNYGFSWTGATKTSNTKVDASTYGQGNYYNSDTFILTGTYGENWDTTANDNLRGGETGVVQGVKELQNAYIGEYVPPIDSPGIYHSATLGLISLSSDGSTRYTIADKNLGATSVFNQGDVETDANCGYFYQWGNNYGFPHSGSVTTSSTQVDTTGYGPGNYYNSSTFITYSGGNWSSVQNDNLWGATTGTNAAMQGPAPSGFHVPTKDEWVALCGMLTNTFGMAGNATTMGTYLKMPMSGNRYIDNADVINVGALGYYWSSTPYDAFNAYSLSFFSSDIFPQNSSYISGGYAIRPFKNMATQPNATWTVLYQPS